ncbi:MAG: type II secretion system F family protein [Bacilli bacterium]|nr:type II secretion system F family protein [Bacilli bacterium]
MKTSLISNLFKNIFHGLIFVLSFFKYFFLGLIRFPILLLEMIKYSGLGIKNIIIREKEEKPTGDQLLIEAKKDAQAKEKQEEKLRNKALKTKQNEKAIKEVVNNNDKLLEEEKPKKTPFSKKIKNFLTSDLGGKKKDINLPELKINFDGDDAKKSKTKQAYEYLIKDPDGKVIKGYYNAYSKVEVHSFLVSEGNKVYKIETNSLINLLHGTHGKSHDKFKTKDLIFFLTQLSTYLKAGISLADACKILVKQFNNPKYKRILRTIVYDLTVGLSFSEALARQEGAFPPILINMIKTAEMTGELPETLDDMEEYFTEIEATRKAMVTAMMYPVIIFVIAIGVGTFIMLYVVPKFVDIYNSMDNASIPGITKAVLALSEFLKKYIIYLGIIVVIILFLFIYLYKNVKAFKRAIQFAIMKMPVFKNVVIYNEVTTFTKTFASLLSHNVFITDSMEILNKITNNEIYKELIYDAINNVSKGKPVSLAFKDHWAFPIPAYEMIVTGEKTGQLPEMMKKVSSYYQDLHKNSVARIKTFIEPVLIIMLTGMVGVIVLSIVVPMFSMYSNIQA